MADLASLYKQWDNEINDEELWKEVDEAAKNGGGNYREVPFGVYEVSIDKMELTSSRKGDPMVSVWFKIEAGEYKNSRIFYYQVANQSFQYRIIKDFLESMDLDCVHAIEESGKRLWSSKPELQALLMDATEEIDSNHLTFQLEYKQNPKKPQYNIYTITDVFEN